MWSARRVKKVPQLCDVLNRLLKLMNPPATVSFILLVLSVMLLRASEEKCVLCTGHKITTDSWTTAKWSQIWLLLLVCVCVFVLHAEQVIDPSSWMNMEEYTFITELNAAHKTGGWQFTWNNK